MKWTFVLVILLCGCLAGVEEAAPGPEAGLEIEKAVREPAVAGSFYPKSEGELGDMVDGFLDAENRGMRVRGLLAPHAGYVFSGMVAGEGYAQLNQDFSKVFILGNNHDSGLNYRGAYIPAGTHYKTPLGEVPLLPLEGFARLEDTTHIIEVQLPFLQKKLGDFEVTPIIFSGLTEAERQSMVRAIAENLDRNTLLVVSSDLSHYRQYEEAVALDQACIRKIEALGDAGGCEMCGPDGVLILMEVAKAMGWKAKIVDYKNSGDTPYGDRSRVVGYSAIVFYEEGLSEADRAFLVELARETVDGYVRDKKVPEPAEVPERLKKVQGCFVTLHKDGQLRGCIGHIYPQEELYRCVMVNGVNAAVNDGRFNPVQAGELDSIDVEVSVLSVPERAGHRSPEELLDMLDGKPGIVLKSGFKQSTYLPQVWEQIPGKELFLANLCAKGGMGQDCWRDPGTEVLVYEADVFGEEALG